MGWESGRRVSARDCSAVRHRRFTSALRPDRLAKQALTLSRTAALPLLPRHRFPIAAALAQPQTAASALKSGLYPDRCTSLSLSPARVS